MVPLTFTASLSDLPAIASRILELSAEGSKPVILFRGPMGAGKTTLIKAICESLGVREKVSSPTFSIVNEYSLPDGRPLYHFDLYRMENPAELFELGYEEYFYSGRLCLVEWPEMAGKLLPEGHLTVTLEPAGDKREITVG